MCGCCGAGYWLAVVAEEKAAAVPHTPSSSPGLARGPLSLNAAEEVRGARAKPGHDEPVWVMLLRFLGRPA
jgi:hypothetical protein